MSFITPKLLLASAAFDAPVPPLVIAKSAPDQSSLLIDKVPPNVSVTAAVPESLNVIPFTLPVPLTDVTLPLPVPAPI